MAIKTRMFLNTTYSTSAKYQQKHRNQSACSLRITSKGLLYPQLSLSFGHVKVKNYQETTHQVQSLEHKYSHIELILIITCHQHPKKKKLQLQFLAA